MATRAFRSVILGPPGAGKGTISSKIASTFDIEHIASGDRLRRNVDKNTYIGQKAKSFMDKGSLVPDTLIIEFIFNEIKSVRTKNDSWMLDGFPRTLNQTKALWDLQELDMVINMEVPSDVLFERVKGRLTHIPSGRVYHKNHKPPLVPGKDDITGEHLVKRNDDKPEILIKRLEEYEKTTEPILKFFNEKKILRTFTGYNSNELWKKLKPVIETFIYDIPSTRKKK